MIEKEQIRPAARFLNLPGVSGAEAPVRKEFLHPGQMCVSSEPCAVTTIVGSCVAICIWDSIARIGGVTHYILAQRESTREASCRYGDVAIEMLVSKISGLSISRHRLQAVVFGGACMFDSFRNRDNHLGRMNVEIGLKLLANHGITVLDQQVGGSRGRKIVFRIPEGNFTVKEI